MIDAMETGGTENQLMEIMKALDPARFKSYLVCLRNSKMIKNMSTDHTTLILDIKSFKTFRILKKIFLLRSFFIAEQIDIVHTFFQDASVLGVLVARLAGIRKIISSRRDMGFWHTGRELRKLRFVNRFVDRFLVNSEAVRLNLHKIEKIGLNRVDVIYNGVNLTAFNEIGSDAALKVRREFNIPVSHIIVGCVANFNRRVKRVDLFIRAAAMIKEACPEVSFLIVGEGCLRGELVRLAEELKMDKDIIFAGQRKDVASLLRGIDIGVLTSDSEGFSNTLLEYMAAGIPAVATDVGGNSELIEDEKDGLLVPPGDARLVAEAVLTLIGDTGLRAALGGSAKRKAYEQFSVAHMVKNMEEYYLHMLCLPDRARALKGVTCS